MTDALSSTDRKTLARLVAKYGRRAVVSAAERVRLPARVGRPRDYDKRGDWWGHVEWIEGRVDELREAGRRQGARKLATFERYKMVTPRDKRNDSALKKFEASVKKAREEYSSAKRALKAERAASSAAIYRPRQRK